MSLIDFAGSGIFQDMFKPCVMMDKRSKQGQASAYTRNYEYIPGAAFVAAFNKIASTEAIVAERQGMNEQYVVTIPRTFTLTKGDVIRRESDQATFLVKSNSKDSESPDASTIQIAKVTAERWDIPDE